MRRILASFLGLAILVAAAWSSAASPASAQTPHPGLNFYLSVEGVPGCSTEHGDATCTIAAGSQFTVSVNLALPPDIPSYLGYDILLSYSGVEPQGQPSTDVWPDCGIPVTSPIVEKSVLLGCAIGLPPAPPSTYQGAIATMNFTCADSGAVVLHNAPGATDLVARTDTPLGQETLIDPAQRETLTITCSPAAATPVPTPTGSAPTPPEIDPVAVVDRLFDALNRGDLSEALTFFANDAGMDTSPLPECHVATCRGQDIKNAFQPFVALHLHFNVTSTRDSVAAVDGQFSASSELLRSAGVDRIVGGYSFLLRHGKITSGFLYLDSRDPQTARFRALYSGEQTPAPATGALPSAGGASAASADPIVLACTSALLSVGVIALLLGLGARRRSRHL